MKTNLEQYLTEAIKDARNEYAKASLIEEGNDYSDAMESMERKYWEGQVDAFAFMMDKVGIPYEGVHEADDWFLCCECREVFGEFDIWQDPSDDSTYCQDCRPDEEAK